MKYTFDTTTREHVFALTKQELITFGLFGRSKRTPIEERAVRFCVQEGRAFAWATDYTCLALLEAGSTNAPDVRVDIDALVISAMGKAMLQTMATRSVQLRHDGSCHTLATMRNGTLAEGYCLDLQPLGDAVTPLGDDVLRATLAAIEETDEEERLARGAWTMAPRTITLLASVSADHEAGAVLMPPGGDGPVVVRAGAWTLAAMPVDSAD